jgi:uncharacterized protein
MFASPVGSAISMTVVAKPPIVESPCIKICALDPASNLCTGCGRTIAEITHWCGMSPDERSRIMAELPQRLASLRGKASPTKPA